MVLMHPLAELQQQCRRSMCLHLVRKPWLSCYYRASLYLWQFLWGDHKQEVFAPSSLSVWNQILWRNLQQECNLKVFCTNSYDLTDCQNLWNCGSISPKTVLIFSKNFLNFWFNEIEEQSIINLSYYRNKSYALVVFAILGLPFLEKRRIQPFVHLSIVFWLYTVLQNQSSSSLNFLVFHTSGGILLKLAAFLFFWFLFVLNWVFLDWLVGCLLCFGSYNAELNFKVFSLV